MTGHPHALSSAADCPQTAFTGAVSIHTVSTRRSQHVENTWAQKWALSKEGWKPEGPGSDVGPVRAAASTSLSDIGLCSGRLSYRSLSPKLTPCLDVTLHRHLASQGGATSLFPPGSSSGDVGRCLRIHKPVLQRQQAQARLACLMSTILQK